MMNVRSKQCLFYNGSFYEAGAEFTVENKDVVAMSQYCELLGEALAMNTARTASNADDNLFADQGSEEVKQRRRGQRKDSSL